MSAAPDPLAVIAEALEAARHISECAEHQDHLDEAEKKAREAFAALASLKREREALIEIAEKNEQRPFPLDAKALADIARAALDGEQEANTNVG